MDMSSDVHTNEVLDLSGVQCPLNYVRAKLKLETMSKGQVLEIYLDDGQPIKNVPLSLKNDGYEIILQTKRGEKSWSVLVKK